MAETQETATGSQDLTVDTAAAKFFGLLSDPSEEKQDRETPPAKEAQATPPESDESEQPEQRASEGESEEQGDDAEQEPAQPRKYRVKVDGQELEVTEDELLGGYSRTADYTRKTQELAEQRKKFEESEVKSVREERQRYATGLAQLENALKASSPAEPDWDKLREQAPDQFAATWAAWQQHEKRMAGLQAERQRAEQKVVEDHQAAFTGYLQSEKTKLLEALPEWKDSEKAKTEMKSLRDFAKESGFSDAEIDQVVDHRTVKLLRNAWLYEQGQKAKPSVQANIERVTVVPPGPGNSTKKPVSDITKAKQRLAKTGRQEDAVAAFLTMLE